MADLTQVQLPNGNTYDLRDPSKLPLSGGNLTGPNVVHYSADNSTYFAGDSTSIIQSPVPKYLWHDLFAFNRLYSVTYYTTTNNSTWATGTVNYDHFAQKDNLSIEIIKATGQPGSRWVWESDNRGSIQWSSASWLVIGFAYTANSPTISLVIDTSTDGTTWTVRHSCSCNINASPAWFKLDGYSDAKYFRLTMTKDASDTTNNVNIGAIKLLTSRWGNQGMGSELEYPYDWNNDGTILPLGNNVANLGSSSRYWKNAYITKVVGSLQGNADTATTATIGNRPRGFSSQADDFSWGNQTGTAITVWNDSSGGSIGFRKDNPSSGKMSIDIDGTIYINEGSQNIGDAIKSITRSGTTFTYTTLWGNTGTFTQQDNNTTYTFANGTNGFTVTPSGGSAQTVTVTPSIANNITGSGTSGYLTKFNGTNTITNGPQLGSSTTTYLRNDGSWATPPDNDTKNTAGSTDTSSKIYLIGATSQAANPQTYSQDTAYVGTDGCLYSGGSKVLTSHQDISGKVNRSGDTMTGALNFANGTANKMGDDAQVGDHNRGGSFGVQGLNGPTTITLLKQGGTWGNTEGGSIQYNATTKSLDFLFT